MALSASLLGLLMFSNLLNETIFSPQCFKPKVDSQPQVQCASDKYPPPSSNNIPHYVINLDLPPEQRWAELATNYSAQMHNLLYLIKNLTHPIFHGVIFELIDKYMPNMVDTLPSPFADEIRGIANATGIAVGEVGVYNLFYEVFTLCTSVVAQSESGQIFHGRNLDFGLFMGWNSTNQTWIGTEILRTLTVKLTFQRNGQPVFMSTSFAGYVGIVTALKPNTFSLSIDERFKFLGGYIGIIEWLLGWRNAMWMSFLTRQVAENATSYIQAQKLLAKTELLAPVYFILGGNKTGQASVITRSFKWFDIWEIGTANSTWFLVETNYDHWKSPPCFDDRRTPAVYCMNEMGQKNLTFSGLFNVLSTPPVLNKGRSKDEVSCVDGEGRHRRVDILAFKPNTNKAYIIDPTIRYETNADMDAEVQREKNDVYDSCAHDLAERFKHFGRLDYGVIGLWFGARGTVSTGVMDFFTKFGLDKEVLPEITETILADSVRMSNHHIYATN